MTLRHRPIDPLAAGATAVAPGHVGRSAGLIDEHQPLRAQPILSGPPLGPLLCELGPLLLLGPE